MLEARRTIGVRPIRVAELYTIRTNAASDWCAITYR